MWIQAIAATLIFIVGRLEPDREDIRSDLRSTIYQHTICEKHGYSLAVGGLRRQHNLRDISSTGSNRQLRLSTLL
jgi:hypothetical protein